MKHGSTTASVTGLPAPTPASPLSLHDIYRGRGVFILGATGFVGKVLLSMLLHRFAEVRRVYVMVRRGSGTSSEDRFWNSVVSSPTFDPLREKHGGAEGLEAYLRKIVRVVDGDITEPNLGLDEAGAAAVAADIDVIINSSGKVTFNPPLEAALRTNVEGTKNVIAFAKRMKRPALIHTSTCFVAGNRSGDVWESEKLDGYFPRWRDLPGTKFSVEQEIADSDRIAAEVRAQADDAQVIAKLRERARARLLEQGRDADDESALKLGIARERKDWIRQELTDRGVARAAEWGWPNIYTYTKSMGDQLVARETGIYRSIVRPAIVESSMSYPFPGWNEGFTTSAPLVYLALKGQNLIPVNNQLILDMVPVDHIAAGMIMVAAQACVEQPEIVHQLSSGDLNPSRINRVATLTGLYKRRRFQDKESGNRFINALAARMEFRPVSYEEYDKYSIPLFKRMADKAVDLLDRARPSWGGGRFAEIVDRVKDKLDDVKRLTDEAHSNIELFLPFIRDNAYVFRADNIRALRDRLPASERAEITWSPETIDWYTYFLDVHFPGLQRWVLPELDETYARKPKSIYAYRDLLELFDTTTKHHATRTAMRLERGKREEVYSYDNLRELATRVGTFLVGHGVTAGDRVMLIAKNAPEWGMSYFGILKTGAVAVPIAHEMTVPEIVNIARASGAVGIIIGDDLHEKRSGLSAALGDAGLVTRVWPFDQVFTLLDEATEAERAKSLVARVQPDTIASIIFTSGTTGKPKGVMLSHRNFTFMVSELSRVFEFGVTDGMLSVLPLHHTFEFSAGLLMPLSRGAQITYLPELTGEAISGALKKGHVTAIVGVPALWELLKRRVMQKFNDSSPLIEPVMKALTSANYELRTRTGLDLGMFLFLPVHAGFGGRIRYLISGGSALSPDVMKTFQGMGFNFYEGYGLTETAPVLSVTPPKSNPIPGSVGKPLPGVELKIDNPDASGVGEVIARGKNLMLGYWQDEAATANVIRDGWFHTGDLGRIDEEGNLFLVGRSKDVIIDSNGKNVYPDEIEELYKDNPFIKELSVVGLPEGSSEQVAAAVVPDLKHDEALSAAQVNARIEEHFTKISAELPFWKRVKTMMIWEGDLPKTAKRSVKRPEVVAGLLKKRGASPEAISGAADKGAGWFLDIVAMVAGRPRTAVAWKSRVAELGFDSLMFNELAEALDRAGVSLPEHLDFTGAVDVAELHQMVVKGGGRGVGKRHREGDTATKIEREIAVPDVVARVGKKGVAFAQKVLYQRVLDTRVTGQMHIPANTNFIVAANHSSHLDMGAIKSALGEAGHNLASLAAADYFFRNRWRRAAFSNFTNLVPMDRAGSIRRSMDAAETVLRRGQSLVVFPEGTRSTTGTMGDFLPSLGYLAARAEVGILPAYIAGTYESLPKGNAVPKSRDIKVRFGTFLSARYLEELTRDLGQQEASRLVSALVQRIVEGLRDGTPVPAGDVAAVRAAWNGQALGTLARPPRIQAKPAISTRGMRHPQAYPPAVKAPAHAHHHHGHAPGGAQEGAPAATVKRSAHKEDKS
ncbi:MAG TPA: AMP-binding protein [Polyangia bacterium]